MKAGAAAGKQFTFKIDIICLYISYKLSSISF